MPLSFLVARGAYTGDRFETLRMTLFDEFVLFFCGFGFWLRVGEGSQGGGFRQQLPPVFRPIELLTECLYLEAEGNKIVCSCLGMYIS